MRYEMFELGLVLYIIMIIGVGIFNLDKIWFLLGIIIPLCCLGMDLLSIYNDKNYKKINRGARK
jgi:hypothetical protein